MAYLQARAGIARSGVTYAGWTPSNLEFRVNNTVRTALYRDFEIVESLDNSPGTFTFTVNPAVFTPSVGQSVSFKWTTPNWYWFAGTITRRELTLDKESGHLWRCEALDNTWLMDRYARVTGSYFNVGFNKVVAHIIGTYTDGGFTVGYCPEALGNIDAIEFDGESVSEALNRLASAAEAFWFVDPERRVYFFDTLPDGNAPTIGNSSRIKSMTYDEDFTQIRTKTIVYGGGSQMTAAAARGAGMIPVADTKWYDSLPMTVQVGSVQVVIESRSTESGPGNLITVEGTPENPYPPFDLAEGSFVQVIKSTSDSTAQTDLATLLGGGLSGVATHVIEDTEFTASEAAAVASSDVNNFKAALKGVEFQTLPGSGFERTITAGQILTVNFTDPATLTGSLRVQTVSIAPWPDATEFTKTVNARQLYRPIPLVTKRA